MVKEKKKADKKGDKSVRSPSSPSDYPEFAKQDGNAPRQDVSPSAAPALDVQPKDPGVKREDKSDSLPNVDTTQYEEPVLTKLIVERWFFLSFKCFFMYLFGCVGSLLQHVGS